jgi:hypothetical protein
MTGANVMPKFFAKNAYWAHSSEHAEGDQTDIPMAPNMR